MLYGDAEINRLSGKVIDIAFYIHNELGPGLFETVYEDVLFAELLKVDNVVIERQVPIPVQWDGVILDRPAFKADIVVDKRLLIEIKSVEALNPIHFKQVETYLRLSGIKLGLLINFNEVQLKNGLRRIVNRL